jgi:hypothetical protein
MRVTGCKTDIWLVKSVSFLFCCIGSAFMLEQAEPDLSLSIITLSFSTAASMACVDLYYASGKVISAIYFIDGAIQLLFMAGAIALFLDK